MHYRCDFAMGFYKICIIAMVLQCEFIEYAFPHWDFIEYAFSLIFCSGILYNMHYHCCFAMPFYRICIITVVLHAGGTCRPLAAPVGPLAAPGGPWRPLASPWRHLVAAPGRRWRRLAGPAGPWRPLAGPGGYWRHLAGTGGAWRLLAAPGGGIS